MGLQGMIKTVEQNIVPPMNSSSTTYFLDIREGDVKRKRSSHPNAIGKGKGKGKVVVSNPKPKEDISNIAPVNDPKEAICYFCQEKGHWKRSFFKYLEDLKKNKPKVDGSLGMFTI